MDGKHLPFLDLERAHLQTGSERPAALPRPPQSAEKLRRLVASMNNAASFGSFHDRCVSPCLGEWSHAVEARVVDGTGAPIENVIIELRQGPAQAMLAKSDADGNVRFTKLAAGGYH